MPIKITIEKKFFFDLMLECLDLIYESRPFEAFFFTGRKLTRVWAFSPPKIPMSRHFIHVHVRNSEIHLGKNGQENSAF
jgi:hypothetical protein